MGGNFLGVKILCYFKEAIILNFSGCLFLWMLYFVCICNQDF